MDNTVYIGKTPIPRLYHIGMTENNRPPEERWKDSDYRGKLPYVPERLKAFSTGNLRDEPVHVDIVKHPLFSNQKEHVDIRSDEIFVGDESLSVEECDALIVKIVADSIRYHTSDCRERLAPFLPRFGQEDAIEEITDILLKDSNCLFAGYTGIGKTLIGLVSVLRYFNGRKRGGLVLATTPIPVSSTHLTLPTICSV